MLKTNKNIQNKQIEKNTLLADLNKTKPLGESVITKMAFFIILRGAAGVGKTTVGQELARALHGECLHIDKILEKNKLGYVIGEKLVPEENFFKINNLICPHIKKQLQQGTSVVLEGNFYHKSQIEDIAEKVGGRFFVFTLEASLEECVRRDAKRNPIGRKRIMDVYKLVSSFDSGIIVDTNGKNPAEINKEIASYLPNISFPLNFL